MKSNLKALSDTQLIAMFKNAITATATGVKRMSIIWVEMKERPAIDLARFTNPMFSFLPAVAAGKLLPEVLLCFGGLPSVVSTLSSVVKEDQKKLADPDFRLPLLKPDGTIKESRVIDLTSSQLRQVVGEGHIRTVTEQKLHMAPVRRLGPAANSKDSDNAYDLSAFLTRAEQRKVDTMAKERNITQAELIYRFLKRQGFFAARLKD